MSDLSSMTQRARDVMGDHQRRSHRPKTQLVIKIELDDVKCRDHIIDQKLLVQLSLYSISIWTICQASPPALIVIFHPADRPLPAQRR